MIFGQTALKTRMRLVSAQILTGKNFDLFKSVSFISVYLLAPSSGEQSFRFALLGACSISKNVIY
jgi:hypothetical protein